MERFMPISEFEDDIGLYSLYAVQQDNPMTHIYLSATFQKVCVLLSATPMLLFKNNMCEVHIHNIDKVLKSKTNESTIYTLYCFDYTDGQKTLHKCTIICK